MPKSGRGQTKVLSMKKIIYSRIIATSYDPTWHVYICLLHKWYGDGEILQTRRAIIGDTNVSNTEVKVL